MRLYEILKPEVYYLNHMIAKLKFIDHPLPRIPRLPLKENESGYRKLYRQ